MADQLTPDQCIDFAAGLLDGDERDEVLRLAAASPEAEVMLQSVMAQAESARATAPRPRSDEAPARRPVEQGPADLIRRFLDWLLPPGRMVPAMAGATLLILGLVIGAGTAQFFQDGDVESGAPARLIALFPSAVRDAGPPAGVTPGTGLYVELNDIDFEWESPLTFSLSSPSGKTVLEGALICHPETGEWAGLHLPPGLLTEKGAYTLTLSPASDDTEPLKYTFTIGRK